MSQEQEFISEAFDIIRQYAVRKQWIPIGWREFRVGPWRIRVNGEREKRDGVPPYHAMIEHDTIIGFMCLSPFGGSVGGWDGTEDAFITAMRAALDATEKP